MRTQGEIEAAICEGISRFEQEYRGRGPKDIHAYLLGDFVVVRLQGLLTPAEQQLAKFPSEKGRDLLKQVRSHLIETAKPLIEAMVQEITGVKVLEPTSRHQHNDRRGIHCPDHVRATLLSPGEENIASLWYAKGKRQGHRRLHLRSLETRA